TTGLQVLVERAEKQLEGALCAPLGRQPVAQIPSLAYLEQIGQTVAGLGSCQVLLPFSSACWALSGATATRALRPGEVLGRAAHRGEACLPSQLRAELIPTPARHTREHTHLRVDAPQVARGKRGHGPCVNTICGGDAQQHEVIGVGAHHALAFLDAPGGGGQRTPLLARCLDQRMADGGLRCGRVASGHPLLMRRSSCCPTTRRPSGSNACRGSEQPYTRIGMLAGAVAPPVHDPRRAIAGERAGGEIQQHTIPGTGVACRLDGGNQTIAAVEIGAIGHAVPPFWCGSRFPPRQTAVRPFWRRLPQGPSAMAVGALQGPGGESVLGHRLSPTSLPPSSASLLVSASRLRLTLLRPGTPSGS